MGIILLVGADYKKHEKEERKITVKNSRTFWTVKEQVALE